MKSASRPEDTFLGKLWKADSVEVSKRVLYFFLALSLYVQFIFQQLPAAMGGGKLHQAEIVIRQDRRSLLDGMEGFKIDKAGKLGPVGIVAESDQSIIITDADHPGWNIERRSSCLKKDMVELVIYTK